MKKVMIGILILIPIIILLVVAMVSSIVSAQAHIAVENIELKYKDSDNTIYELPLNFKDVADKVVNLKDYLDVVVSPQKANNYTIEWKISGDISYTDSEYENKYKQYINNPSSSAKVWPAATFVDENGNETASSTSGKIVIGSYCTFTVQVVAENVSKTIGVKVVGYDVERVEVRAQSGEGKLSVGESVRLIPSYTPIDSIVNDSEWTSSDTQVAIVDQNGVVTGVGEGKAVISHGASVFSTGAKVYGTCEVEVSANGASVRYGSRIVTSKSTLTLSELGISGEAVAVSGCTIENGEVKITASKAVLSVNGKNFEIEKCDADEIVINNKDFYEYHEDGYVLAVGEHTLKLSAIWADMTNETVLTNVSWKSNNESVATVNEKGEVKGVSRGLATITATANGKSASVTINVQNKLASVQLRTSQASLAVGLARETVFASQRFLNPTSVRSDDTKIANSTLIVVQGEPENATAEELDLFYSSFNFEVVEGGEYAHFDQTVRNKLVFSDEGKALEGKGKQSIKVRVSAKYPKYEGMSKFTTQEVTINAIYGVAVSSVAEIEVAAKNQRAYAEAEGNIIPSQIKYEITNAYDSSVYRVRTNPSSKTTYAICFEGNVGYTIAEQGEHLVGPDERLNFYGDVYGNNFMLSTETNQLDENTKIMRISWSNVTMSNLILRANNIAEDKTENTLESAEDTKDFTGILGIIGSHVSWDTYRLENVRMEYCILENAKEAINVNNSDATFDGCIIRNLKFMGINTQCRMHSDGEVFYPYYAHLNFHNIVFSNTLGSVAVVNYENYTIKGKVTDYRFAATAEENDKWFMDNFYANGINFVLNQTGFIDAYNWQPVSSATLIDAGNEYLNTLIANASDEVMRTNSFFESRRIIDSKDACWIHIAFVSAGVTTNFTIEKVYSQITTQDKRLSYINTADMQVENTGITGAGEKILKNVSAGIWGYDNKQNIQPTTTYQVNDALIDRLHK